MHWNNIYLAKKREIKTRLGFLEWGKIIYEKTLLLLSIPCATKPRSKPTDCTWRFLCSSHVRQRHIYVNQKRQIEQIARRFIQYMCVHHSARARNLAVSTVICHRHVKIRNKIYAEQHNPHWNNNFAIGHRTWRRRCRWRWQWKKYNKNAHKSWHKSGKH